MKINCPLCGSDQTAEYVYSLYVTCVKCQHTYQPKQLKPARPIPNSEMSDTEKEINLRLATWIFERYRPESVLDIDSGYPFFAHCFDKIGADAYALDPGFYDNSIKNDLNVTAYGFNFWDFEIQKQFDLITMIHVFARYQDPIATLKRTANLLADNGILYLRGPSKDVPGIDRDHNPHTARLHPHIFGAESMKYAAKKAGLYPIWAQNADGYGQTSWLFKKQPPRISLCMIVKNEEKNLPDCLESVKGIVDEIIILDTGSTDKTQEVAEIYGAKFYQSEQFDEHTARGDFHFANARNESLGKATGDWILWLDADDRYKGPRPTLELEVDVYPIQIVYGDTIYQTERLLRNWCPRFSGAVHEYPVISDLRSGKAPVGIAVHHLVDHKEGRVGRNIAILETEYQEDSQNKRTIFYLANSYREAGKHDKAIAFYQKYIALGGNFHDELVLAYVYLADSYYYKKDYRSAIKIALDGLKTDDKWAEFYYRLAESYFYIGDFKKAASYFHICEDMPLPHTNMFVRQELYDRMPKRYLSHCYEYLDDLDRALEYAYDENRRAQLENKVHVIEVVRPGALGDVLCATPAVHELRKKYPKSHIRFVTHPSSKPMLECNPDIDEIAFEEGKWANEKILFQYPMDEGFPYTPMNRHLAIHFAENAGVELPEGWKPILNLKPDGELKIEYKKPMVTFAVKTGWSVYKEWPLERWPELIKRFPEYQWVQLGAPGEPEIEGAHYMCGKFPIREAFMMVQKSALFVGLDSVFNHVARAVGTPAVIMFGSTNPAGHGYSEQLNLASGHDCQPCYRENNEISVHKKSPCPYAHKCMVDYMTVDRVAEAISKIMCAQVEPVR